MALSSSQPSLSRRASLATAASSNPTRHKCFISYHHEDENKVGDFIERFNDVLIAKVLGVSDDDDFIDSDDTDYVMRRIRELYLTDSTITIVMVGKCTWARRYVDWEIASTLRNDDKNKRSGLLGITLPSAAIYSGKKAPERLDDNLPNGPKDGYARWNGYPTGNQELRNWLQDAFNARDSRSHLIDNTAALFKNNRSCP